MSYLDTMLSTYTESMSRLPILVLECPKGGHLERGACERGL